MSTRPRPMAEQLNGSMNAKEAIKEGYTLVEHNEVPNTPFTATKDRDGWFLRIGNYRLTEFYETEEQAIKALDTEFWQVIFRAQNAITYAILHHEKLVDKYSQE